MNLNLQIAEIKGLQWNQVQGDIYKNNIPDYQNDWNYLGPLVLELLDAGWAPVRYAYHVDARYTWVHNREGTQVSDDNFGTATCMALLKEFGGE